MCECVSIFSLLAIRNHILRITCGCHLPKCMKITEWECDEWTNKDIKKKNWGKHAGQFRPDVGEKKEKEKYTWSWFMSLFSELVSWDLKCNGKMHHFSCHLSFEISLKNITSQEYKTSVFLLILTVKWEYIVWIYADVTVTAPLDLAKCCAQYVPGENGWGRRWER